MTADRPVILPSGDLWVPQSLCGPAFDVFLAWMGACRGIQWPTSAPAPRLAKQIHELANAFGAAAQASPAGSSAVAAGAPGAGRSLGVREAAGRLQCSPRRVRQLIEDHKLEARRGPRNIWLVDEASVEERIARGTYRSRARRPAPGAS